VEAIAADATDVVRMAEICAGADTVYHCALPPMRTWLPMYVDVTAALITAAGQAGARLVYADDTWMYGKVDGPMREDSPIRPVCYKGVLRALAAELVLSAHARGQTETAIVRAAELYGPRVESLLGANVFTAAIHGKKVMWPGDPDQPMTATYIGDFGRALADIGQHPDVAGTGASEATRNGTGASEATGNGTGASEATGNGTGASEATGNGNVFHVQVAPVITGRMFIEMIGRVAGSSPRVGQLTPRLVGLMKLVAPVVREGAELLYQFDRPFLVDDSRIRHLTGRDATSWDDGIRQTLDWYRADPERSRYRLIPGKH
jgi:nucleoside-diphosphate-sugar epimerase